MVGGAVPSGSRDGRRDEYYDELAERWPERPSRRQAKRTYRRKAERRVVVRSERLAEPDTPRMSRALLAAERELAKARAEQAARAQEDADGHA